MTLYTQVQVSADGVQVAPCEYTGTLGVANWKLGR